jgi:hypothetical protein
MRRYVVTGLVALVLCAAGHAAAQGAGTVAAPLPELRSDAARTRAEQVKAAQEYKAALERLLALREAEVQRATENVEHLRQLLARGLVARNDLAVAERSLSQARVRADETWNEAIVASSIIAKALVQEELAAAPPPPPGQEQVTPSLLRFRGTRPWSLALTRSVEEFFSRTFGRTLPVSAYGQTRVHDRLGLDHRNAVDVAVHPDSEEGRAVIGWLKQAGLSFIAFRNAVAGASTGAHIHIGEPSPRLAMPLP